MDIHVKTSPTGVGAGAAHDPPGHDLEALLERIVREHHRACGEGAQLALFLARRLARGGDPLLATIAELVETLVIELHAHVDREDRALLSRVRILLRASGDPRPGRARRGELERAMHAMTLDHQATALLFEELRARTGGYQAPAHASQLWRGLYELLAELESDFRRAVHEEEQIFFPLARELEADVGC